MEKVFRAAGLGEAEGTNTNYLLTTHAGRGDHTLHAITLQQMTFVLFVVRQPLVHQTLPLHQLSGAQFASKGGFCGNSLRLAGASR